MGRYWLDESGKSLRAMTEHRPYWFPIGGGIVVKTRFRDFHHHL
jgi:hypothetical protein